MCSISVRSHHPRLRLDRRGVARALRVLEENLAGLGTARSTLANPGELSVVFLTDAALARLHGRFLADPALTDVITFAGDPALGAAGEICVSADAAARFAAGGSGDFSEELTLYLAHGWLHLAGHDDRAPAAKRAMRRAEARALRALRAAERCRGFHCGLVFAPLGNQFRAMLAPPSRFVTYRNAFFSGALLLAPLVVTIWAFSKIIDLVGGTFRPFFFFYLPETLRDRPSLEVVWDILATLIVVLLVTLLGFLSRDVFGRFFVSVAERFMLSIPGVGAVYVTVKQIVDTFSTQNRNMFSKVVLVEFPRKGTWAMGFLTNKVQGEPQSRAEGEVWTVFVPTTPNPTSGFLIMLPPREIVELEMTVGEGMKMIISGGAVVPPWPAPSDAGRE